MLTHQRLISPNVYRLTLLVTCLLSILNLAPRASCQIGNIFEQFFNQGGSHHEDHEGHGGHEERGQGPQGSYNRYEKLYDQTSCSQYLCPGSLACVSRPVECPCLYEEDVKCPIASSPLSAEPDTFICTRAPGCARIQKALKLGSSS